MFDFFIEVGDKNIHKRIYSQNNRFYKNKEFVHSEYSDEYIVIKALNYTTNNKYFLNSKNFVILISGAIYHKFNFKQNSKELFAEDILTLYINSELYFLKTIKGDFTIVIYNKIKNELLVIQNQLALKPLYYLKTKTNIIISNNLNHFKIPDINLDQDVLLEKVLFGYPLFDNETYFKDVKCFKSGEILYIKNISIDSKIYYDLNSLIFNTNNKKFDPQYYIELFNHSVAQKANDEKIAVSFTGGFDGRGIVSSLLKLNKSFITYSFGKKGGKNTSIPMKIMENLNLEYIPYFLEENYEKEYFKFAEEAIYFSDGTSNNERANYLFVFNQISKITNKVLSGLVAGEIIRPLHLLTDYINPYYYEIIFKNKNFKPIEHLSSLGILTYFNQNYLQQIIPELIEKINRKKEQIKYLKNNSPHKLFYLADLITNGFKRFYGSEIHMERFYAHNQTPYYDIDLLEYLLNTDYKKYYSKAFQSNNYSRMKSQELYYKLYKINYPELNNYPVDRGYKPKLLSNFAFLPIILFKINQRKKRLKKARPEFQSNIWSELFYKNINISEFNDSELFNVQNIIQRIQSKYSYNQEFNQIFGLYYWNHIL